jgi:hypothetical protein
MFCLWPELFFIPADDGTVAQPVNFGETMDDHKHARAIMEYLSACELRTTDGVALHTIVERCTQTGMTYEDVHGGLISASTRGLVLLTGDFVHLTEAGYVALNVANDNPSDKG